MIDTSPSAPEAPGWTHTPSVLDGVAVLAMSAVFWLLGGVVGAVTGVGIGLALFVLPSLFVFALAQVTLAALLPEDPTLATVAVGELPLVLLLVATLELWTVRRRVAVSLVIGGSGVALGFVAVAAMTRLWLSSLLVIGAIAIAVYGFHRYAIVLFEYPTHD